MKPKIAPEIGFLRLRGVIGDGDNPGLESGSAIRHSIQCLQNISSSLAHTPTFQVSITLGCLYISVPQDTSYFIQAQSILNQPTRTVRYGSHQRNSLNNICIRLIWCCFRGLNALF